ncbi:MAG: hypothetical protein VX949_11580 [Planctomycetota bacterium]|nr:hypothetical protein [Planctomycetota bacterium]
MLFQRGTFLLIAAVLVFGAPLAGDEPGKIDRQRADLLRDLQASEPPTHKRAMEQILLNRDAALLPELEKLLTLKDSSLRRRITMLVLRAFPDQAFDFFGRCLAADNVHSQEAAAHGFGFISDLRVAAILEPLLGSTNRVLKIAALRGFQSQIMPLAQSAFRRVAGGEAQDTAKMIECSNAALAAIERAHQSKPADGDLSRMRLRLLDSKNSSSARESWLSATAETGKDVAGFKKLFSANDSWIGRARPPARLDYNFSMVNFASDSNKEIEIHSTVEDMESLRMMGYDLDRVIHLRTASDLLFCTPSGTQPEMVSESGSANGVIRLQISSFPFRHAGIGLLNISYWEGTIRGADHAHIQFDLDSGRIIEESIFDESGKLLWKLVVQSWLPGHRYPAQLLLDMPGGRSGARAAHLRFELTYQLAKEAWVLKEGTTSEVVDAVAEIRAHGEVALLPAPEAVESAEDSSGQGSDAATPRE